MTDKDLIIAAAKEVMGWTVYTSGRGSAVAVSPQEDEMDRILATTHPWESVEWNPLGSIADAWMLVERMREKGRHCLILRSYESGLTVASFYLGPHDRSDLSATDMSAPRAITLAALRAIGEVAC
jgi:hypothetical protein